MKRKLKSVLGVGVYPLIRYFEPRFANIHARLDQTNHELVKMRERLDQFEQRMLTDVETTLEISVTLQRVASRLERRLAQADELTERELRPLGSVDSQAPGA